MILRQSSRSLESTQQGHRGYFRPVPEGGLEHGVYLIKPNLHEFQNWLELPPDDASLIEAGGA